MRTLDLLKALSETEIQDVAKLLSENKRKSLVQLFNELRKYAHQQKDPESSKLFKSIFGNTYSKQKDYLLRHELRLLNEILYEYLAKKTFLNHFHKNKNILNYWLARAYHERNMNGLFASDINEFIAQTTRHIVSSESQNLSEGTALLAMKSIWMIQHQPKVVGNIQQQIETLHQWKLEEKKRFLYKLREIEAREAYLEMYLGNLRVKPGLQKDDNRTKGEHLVDLRTVEEENRFAKYLVLKKYSYQTRKLKRVEVLKQMLSMEETEEGTKLLGINAQISTLVNLAIEFILLGKYAEGDEFLEESISRSEQYKHPLLAGGIHNYLVNQINLSKYEKGIKIYERFKKLIESSRNKNASRIFLCYCYLFLGNEDEAVKRLPKLADVSIPEQIMIRFVYAIALFIRKEYALAVSEINNLRRTIKAIKPGDYSKQMQIADLFFRYINAHTKT